MDGSLLKLKSIEINGIVIFLFIKTFYQNWEKRLLPQYNSKRHFYTFPFMLTKK